MCSAAVIESRYISCMLSPPPVGELVKTCPSAVPAGGQRRKIFLALQYLARGLDPVVHEGRLHLRDRRALEPVVRVAPMLAILRIARPSRR